MFGAITSNNNGLRTLSGEGRLLICTYAGYTTAYPSSIDPNRDGQLAYSRLSLPLSAGDASPFFTAYSHGVPALYERHTGYQPQYFWDVYHLGDVWNTPMIYLFQIYEPGSIPISENYGFEMYDAIGRITYSSELLTLRIVGYVTKKNKIPTWIDGYNPSGRKLAFSQIGCDYSFKTFGIGGGQWRGEVASATIIESANNGIVIHENKPTYYGETPFDTSDNYHLRDVFYYILDVTNIPTKKYPALY